MGWGSSTRRGGGRKVRALPRSVSSLGLEGRSLACPGNFARMSQTPGGVQKVCANKVCVYFSTPIRVSLLGPSVPLMGSSIPLRGHPFPLQGPL